MTDTTGPRIYNLFPRLVGTVAAWKEALPRIADMGFDWVFINPFHETGGSGSLYAVRDPYTLNRIFDDGSGRPGEEQIADFCAAAERHGISVMMDLVVNHTADDAPLVHERPDWYVQDEDGNIQNPYALDIDTGQVTVWGDLAEIDYGKEHLRGEIADYWRRVAAHWAGHGVRGFRCDAAYKVPGDVWRIIIDGVREARGDAVMAAETLGCAPEQVEQLRPAGFDFLFNSSKWWDFKEGWLLDQYEQFRHIAPSIAFPETHDTDRLINELTPGVDPEKGYRRRYMFAAAFSTGVMMTIGYEYGFRKPLHVVETTPDDWETPSFDIRDFVREVNRAKARHPVLNQEGPQQAMDVDGGAVVAIIRRANEGPGWALTLVNIDLHNGHSVDQNRLGFLDLNNACEITPGRDDEGFRGNSFDMEPGEVRVIVRREG